MPTLQKKKKNLWKYNRLQLFLIKMALTSFDLLFYILSGNSVQINDLENRLRSQGNCLAFCVHKFQR